MLQPITPHRRAGGSGTMRALGLAVPATLALALLTAPGALAHDTGSHAAQAATTGGSQPAVSALPRAQPRRGLVYEGLRAATGSQCPGGFVLEQTGICTHGPDAAPADVDVDRAVQPLPDAAVAAAASARTSALACGSAAGRRTEVIYAHAPNVVSRYAAFLPSFRTWAEDANAIYRNSAAETGGERNIVYLRDAACDVIVRNVAMDEARDDDNFNNTIVELQRQGFNRSDRKYMIFVDASVYCGIGTIFGDDDRSGNASDGGPGYGRADTGCWNAGTVAHEHMHNLGGVQPSAPNTSGGSHCVDEWDLMCYSDAPLFPVLQFKCTDAAHNQRFDWARARALQRARQGGAWLGPSDPRNVLDVCPG